MAKSKVPVRLPGDPANALDAAPKQYVDLRAVPPGGEVGQALVKVTADDYDYEWQDQSGEGGGGGGPHGHPESDITNLVSDLAALDGRVDELEAAPPPVLDHGDLEGLADDDHTQYYNQTRGDARYVQLTDGRLTDARDPLAHAASHDVGESDDLSSLYVPWVNVGISGGVAEYDDSRLSDARTPVAHNHPIADITGLQTALDGKEADGAAADAVADHEAASDPHPQYLTSTEGNAAYAALSHNHSGVYDPAGTAAAAVSAHAALSDPHPGYLTPAEGNAAYAALSHDHSADDITSGVLAIALLPVGTEADTVAAGDDGRFSDAREPLDHASSHGSGGSDPVTPAAIGAATSGHTHDLSGYVPTSRTITAGTGLTGGGDLSANRTLTVAYGTSSTTAARGDDARLSDARTPVAHEHDTSDITSGVLDIERLPVGDAVDTVAAGDDPRFTDAREPLAHDHVIDDVTGLQDALDDKEDAGTAATAITAHEAASNPHPGYLTATEADAAYAALSHNHSGSAITSGTVAYARLPVGTAASTIAAGNDSRFTDARTPTSHTHNASDVNAGTLAFARIPTGSTSTTVAVGNHTHEGMSSGGGFASGVIPSGTTTPEVEHGLGTKDLIIQVREVATDLLVRVAIETIDDNNLRFTFSDAPTSNQYRYTALSAAATLGTGAHTHPESDVTDLQDDLDAKADLGHTHVIADVTGLQDDLDDKSDVGHTHGEYLTPTAADADYAAIDHTHTLGSLGAAAASHTHAAADIDSGTLAIARIPTGTTGTTVSLGNHTHSAATPAAHAASHGTGQSDAISPASIGASATGHAHAGSDLTSGTIPFARIPVGTSGSTVTVGNDSRLSDARTPTAHKSSHATGGGDALTAADIGALDQTAGDARYRQHNQGPRTQSVTGSTANADIGAVGDLQITVSTVTSTTLTLTNGQNGRTCLIEVTAATGATRTVTIGGSPALGESVDTAQLVIPAGGTGRFLTHYSTLGSIGYSVDSCYLVA